ncbi:uncharacterized protein LOC128553613 [Mercenaria mercenaria]|uniref:uncharacterized protein LOC128553613 n=1 Tax=Mercenaria mercenaria TaxID=6596 RepID=UPI00234F4022|nr:uncharacterized protein LOC128553613 [Mercenaria mercenaria]
MYRRSRSSSCFSLNESISSDGNDNNISALLNRVSINKDTASESLAEDNRKEDPKQDERVIFMCTNTGTDCRTANSDPDVGDRDSDDDKDFDADIDDVFKETRQLHGPELSEKFSEYLRPVTEEIDLHDIEKSIDNIPQETQAEEPVLSCANCSKPRRVENVSCLKKGQHIRLPGQHLKFNFGRKLINVYEHHAIVKRVNKIFENSVEIVLIHFSKENNKISINEATTTYNLENDEIDIIDYERPRYDPEKIVQRAESMLPTHADGEETKHFRSYNFVCCNCEHFASWCVVGDGESFQAKSALKTSADGLSKLAGVGSKCWRFIKRFMYNASDEIAAGSGIGLNLPGVVLGATAFIYLIYTVFMTVKYRLKYSRRQLCKVCFWREISTLWTSFGAFCVTSGISYILVHFLLPLLSPTPVGIPLLLVLVVLSLTLQWGITKVVKALRSPYACDEIEVKHLSQITPGSMISFKYFGISHYAIVTGKLECDESEIGVIRCVHYGLKSFNVFGTRKVLEEYFELNMNENIRNVKLIDCRHLKTFPPDVVVSRAKARIEETKWSVLSNRSDHLCFDTLVQEENEQNIHQPESDSIDNSKSKHKSSFYIGKKEIHLRSDLQIGHIVKFKIGTKFWATNGIVVWLEDKDKCSEQAFKMDLIVYRDYWAIRRKYSIDLKRDRLFIRKYHPAHCCPFDNRVNRALQKEGKKGDFWTENGFLRSCILK